MMMKFNQRNFCAGCGKGRVAPDFRLWLAGMMNAAKDNL